MQPRLAKKKRRERIRHLVAGSTTYLDVYKDTASAPLYTPAYASETSQEVHVNAAEGEM